MLCFTISNKDIKNAIFIPKYYDPSIIEDTEQLKETHILYTIGQLIDDGFITVQTGHEIGKLAYGTGNIPFVRTSDITNWEIKTIPKQGVSEEIYKEYASKEKIQIGDILLVRDGSYLIGTNCMVTLLDLPILFQSHILKFHINDNELFDKYLFFFEP